MTRRIPELETERLLIRELTLLDLESINRVLNQAFGMHLSAAERERWLQWTVLGYEMLEMLAQPHYGERAVISKATGDLIGAVGIVPYLDTFNRVTAFQRALDAPATAEVGLFWAIAPAYQGQGFASEAARALVGYLFTREKLGRIIATTGYNNLPSQKVMLKLGMTLQQLDDPHLPDQNVVGVLVNDQLSRDARGGAA